MTSTTEPTQARLGEAGENVRDSVITPAPATEPPVTAVVTNAPPPAPISPAQPVPTRGDLLAQQTRQPQPIGPRVQNVQVGPGAPVTHEPIVIQQVQHPALVPAAPVTPIVQQPVAVASAAATPAAVEASSIQDVARQYGEELVGPGASAPVPTAGPRKYEAQPGDSVSRMASRLMGGNTKANRDAILNANPALKENPDRVIVGRTYVIPAAPRANPPAAAPIVQAQEATIASAPLADTPVEQLVPIEPAGPSEPGTWYTVKADDSLWKIAAEQLGSGNEWTTLRDMNKDVLKGGDTVQPNMRLRLPHRPVASAQ
jgi:nucleoid-associated protein YgaU